MSKDKTDLLWVITILATITFVVLKIAKVIHWSWVWVFCPLWLPICFAVVTGFICAIVIGICDVVLNYIDMHKKGNKNNE